MKAALFMDKEKFAVREVPNPKCPPDGLVVRVEACAICGSDIRSFLQGPIKYGSGRIPGHEFAGIIAEIGPDVSGYEVGERITVSGAIPCGECYQCRRNKPNICDNFHGIGQDMPGAFAEFVVIPGSAIRCGNVNRVPEGLSPAYATLADPLASVLNGQEPLDISVGDTVLVIGAGPIGCMHALMARYQGAVKVVLAQRSKKRLELAKRMNAADTYISVTEEDLRERVMQETGGHGPDVVIVACPSSQAQLDAINLVAKGGRVSLFGGLPKAQEEITINANYVHYNEISIHGAFAVTPRGYSDALALVAGGRIKSEDFITHYFPLDEIQTAFSKEVREQAIKIIIEP